MSYDGFEVELEGVFVDAEPAPASSNRWVLAWAAGVVAVLAVLAWWAGRSSDPEAGPSPEPAGPEASPAPAEPAGLVPGEPVPDTGAAAVDTDSDAASGAATGPGAETEDDGAPVRPSWAEVGKGSGYDLLGIDRQGHLAVLDFDAGSIARFGLPSVDRGLGTESAVLRAGDRLAAVYEGRLILVGAGAEPEVLAEQAFGWQGLPGDPPVFWGFRSGGTPAAVPADGGAPVDLPGPARPVAVWDDRILVQAAGDIVLVPVDDPSSAALYAPGRVVAASTGAVAYQTCEVLDCRFLVGRPGEPEWIEVPEWAESSLFAGPGASPSALSPDGTMMIRPQWQDSGARLLVHDLAGPAPVVDAAWSLPFDAFLRRVLWSPDNRLAVIETGPGAGPGEFRVMRTGDGAMARLPEDLVGVVEFVPEPPDTG